MEQKDFEIDETGLVILGGEAHEVLDVPSEEPFCYAAESRFYRALAGRLDPANGIYPYLDHKDQVVQVHLRRVSDLVYASLSLTAHVLQKTQAKRAHTGLLLDGPFSGFIVAPNDLDNIDYWTLARKSTPSHLNPEKDASIYPFPGPIQTALERPLPVTEPTVEFQSALLPKELSSLKAKDPLMAPYHRVYLNENDVIVVKGPRFEPGTRAILISPHQYARWPQGSTKWAYDFEDGNTSSGSYHCYAPGTMHQTLHANTQTFVPDDPEVVKGIYMDDKIKIRLLRD